MKPDDTLRTRPTLLSKVRRGDEEGWSQFFELYSDWIYSAARAAGLSHDEAKDTTQEAMVSVRNYIDRFVPDVQRGRFRTWLRHIVHSRIADHYRRKRRNPLEHAVEEYPGDESSTSTTARIPNLDEVELDRLIDSKLEAAIFAEAQRRMKEMVRMEDYQAYELFDVQELSAKEVAASLGIAVSTVRVKALRVRRIVTQEATRIVKVLAGRGHC